MKPILYYLLLVLNRIKIYLVKVKQLLTLASRWASFLNSSDNTTANGMLMNYMAIAHLGIVAIAEDKP